MKRDMGLVRAALLEVESQNGAPSNVEIPGYSEEEIKYHLRLLLEAGLIHATKASTGIFPKRLTWEGHEFLDAIRPTPVWEKVKERAGQDLGSAPLAVIKALAIEASKQLFGLS